jgi:hypothetical protein
LKHTGQALLRLKWKRIIEALIGSQFVAIIATANWYGLLLSLIFDSDVS